jgi:hypothetical protein
VKKGSISSELPRNNFVFMGHGIYRELAETSDGLTKLFRWPEYDQLGENSPDFVSWSVWQTGAGKADGLDPLDVVQTRAETVKNLNSL